MRRVILCLALAAASCSVALAQGRWGVVFEALPGAPAYVSAYAEQTVFSLGVIEVTAGTRARYGSISDAIQAAQGEEGGNPFYLSAYTGVYLVRPAPFLDFAGVEVDKSLLELGGVGVRLLLGGSW